MTDGMLRSTLDVTPDPARRVAAPDRFRDFCTIGRLTCMTVAACLGLGCGGAPHDNPMDAGGDGLVVDAPPSPITVTVYSHDQPGVPASGVRVLFQEPDGAIHTVLTDAHGIATAAAPAGTTATVIQNSVTHQRTLFSSFQMLEPGDSVVVGPRQKRPTTVGDIRLEFPSVPGGKFYTVSASCPFTGALIDFDVPTVARFSPQTPCTTATAATIVGRVKDAKNNLLGVSLLENVDLLAAIGGTVAMPAFELPELSITGSFSNIPTNLDWTVGYGQGDEIVLEHQTVETTATGSVELAMKAYPVGNQSTFNITLMPPDLNGTFSSYHGYRTERATHFEMDAAVAIKSIQAFSPTIRHDAIDWTSTAEGRDPTIVVSLVESGTTRGVIYAPYAGSTLSLTQLPTELFMNGTPSLRRLKHYDIEGSTYHTAISVFQELEDLDLVGTVLPSSTSYWTSAFPTEIPSPG